MGFNTVNDAVNHKEDYGQGYYMGTVTVNTDPHGVGMVQAQVPGLYDSTAGAVPWIGAIKDSPFGFGTGAKGPYGVYGFPQVGSTVKVELQNGDEHKPLYSTLYTVPNAHPWFNVPTRWGYVDPSGNSLQVDMAANTWLWTHESGDTISFDGLGNVVKVVNGNDTSNVTGNIVFQVTGNATINCEDFVVDASGTATYTATSHQFNGPIMASSTIAAEGNITDQVGTGNAQSMEDMRTYYNEHDHEYYDNGTLSTTSVPNQQIP
jgi:hypothetical protein